MNSKSIGLLFAVGGCVVVAIADEGIRGSKHDFSQFGWSKNQVCLPCHTPHDAKPNQIAPLWDRSPEATGRFKLYNNRPTQPGAGSLVCLSCHDGGTALDAFGGSQGETTMLQFAPGKSVVGAHGDLNGNHPIGVEYPANDKGYRTRASVETDGEIPLPDGKVECISCHDVHNELGHEHLLAKSNDRSALCLSCHRK